MIIEIKDLPEGRKVSRILVDVTFEDTGVSQSVSQSFLNDTKVTEDSVSPAISATSAPEVKRVLATNPGIPAEMLDMEF